MINCAARRSMPTTTITTTNTKPTTPTNNKTDNKNSSSNRNHSGISNTNSKRRVPSFSDRKVFHGQKTSTRRGDLGGEEEDLHEADGGHAGAGEGREEVEGPGPEGSVRGQEWRTHIPPTPSHPPSPPPPHLKTLGPQKNVT